MKKILVWFSIMLILAGPAYACTSFAVYFDQPIYGMNLDLPGDTDITFFIEEDEGGLRIFSPYFLYKGITYGRNLVMTSRGQFRAVQEQYSSIIRSSLVGLSQAGMHDFLTSRMLQYDLAGTLEWLQGKRLVHYRGSRSHLLAADSDGKAAIFEVGEEGNEIIPITDDFIVMTNFKNSDFKDVPYDEIKAAGADRYIIAYEHILANRNNFDLTAALQGLEKTIQVGATKCSMVFLPNENNIYFALNGSFKRIWRLSLADNKVYTFQGFAESASYSVPREGLTAAFLLSVGG